MGTIQKEVTIKNITRTLPSSFLSVLVTLFSLRTAFLFRNISENYF